jgi:hypothetical protein
MAQQTNDLRERLLADLPQPENLAAYREETATLLAKHARAVRWDGILGKVLSYAFSLVFFGSLALGPSLKLSALALHQFQFLAALLFLLGVMYDLRYRIYSSQVDTLKEIKQVQLQVLELQASMQKAEDK